MEILFEDESLIACVKPVGVLSQNSDSEPGLPDLLAKHTGTDVFTVHRLDKGVGGVMVYAKTAKAAAALSEQIAAHRFVKEYYAAVSGAGLPERATLEDLLFKDSSKNKTYPVKRIRKGVKKASLSYDTVLRSKSNGNCITVVHIRLHTGRSHQIRVQFASRKHPLLGDKKYGARDNEKNIALWSYRITLTHPESGEPITFTAAPPPDTTLGALLLNGSGCQND